MDPETVNLVDVGALALLLVGLLGGIRSGALPQLAGFFGAIAGAASLLALAPIAADLLDPIGGTARTLIVFGGLIAIVGIGEVTGTAIGRSVSASLGNGVLGLLDRVFGGFVGMAQAVLIVWLVGSLLAIGPSNALAAQAQRSTAVRVATAVLPPVAEVASDVGRLIDRSGLPQVFVGLEPLPVAPVDAPRSDEAATIAASALGSTVEVRSGACAFELTGTGFVVERGYVVTNAHVVAGALSSRVLLAGRSFDAVVVLFDPELDIALLHAPLLPAPPLVLAAEAPPRGAVGAVLGHPGGAPLTVVPGAVNRTYQAEGRDLYGERTVTRDIVELRSAIERGDSGGPFILEDGSVGGVVFAEARSDPEIGYALDPAAVATTIAPALGRASAVDTGPCIR